MFTPPRRPALKAATWEEACEINERLTGKRLSKQAWAIAPKVREVDRFLRNEPRAREVVREVHPELLFWALNGRRPMREKKSRVAGRRERLAVLSNYLPGAESVLTAALARRNGVRYQADDVIDALAAAVVASRAYGLLNALPEHPPRDAYGLPMEMVYWEAGQAK